MILFELFASLGLDLTSFREQSDIALSEGKTVADSVSGSFESIQETAEDSESKLKDLEEKSQGTSAIAQGFVEATGEVVEEVIKKIIEFGAQSIEMAAATGSELANSFNAAKDSFDLTVDALKLKTGNVLLPIAEGFYQIVESLTGVTDAERFELMLSRLSEYEFSNLEQLRSNLDGVFSMFDSVDAVEGGNVSEMTSALESQAAYWTDYADTLDALRSRNINPNFLAEIADGTQSSLETLKALETADETQLTQLMAAYEAVQETRESTLAGLNEIQIAVDEELLAMTQSIEELVAGMNQEDAARANASLTGEGVADGLAAAAPSISAWVDYINSKLAQIGNAPLVGTYQYQLGVMSGDLPSHYASKASGLGYVPYDGYRAELHRGEEVLTRQQAEEYRAGRANNADNTAVVEEIRSLKNAILGLTLTVDRQVIGRIASEEIAREAGVF